MSYDQMHTGCKYYYITVSIILLFTLQIIINFYTSDRKSEYSGHQFTQNNDLFWGNAIQRLRFIHAFKRESVGGVGRFVGKTSMKGGGRASLQHPRQKKPLSIFIVSTKYLMLSKSPVNFILQLMSTTKYTDYADM